MLTKFKEYLNDEKAAEMFISGQAGTGKTTGLSTLISYCMEHNINYIVCAYTHKACGILKEKLPNEANIVTLHKFLKKRPTINEHALDIRHLQNSQQQGKPAEYKIMFLDEYSMLGEKDYSDIGTEQYLSGDDIPDMKVIYLGDPNQLPPIQDQQAIYPSGKYNIKLTKIYRQDGDSDLLYTLTQLVKMIEGAKPEPLQENNDFIRSVDIPIKYHECIENKIMLAYTNGRVQDLNATLAGKAFPEHFDEVFSPTTKHYYDYLQPINKNDIAYIDLPFGEDQLAFGTKYKTLEHLIKMDCCDYALLEDIKGGEHIVAYVFGHYVYKSWLEALGADAVQANKDIEDKHKVKAKQWAFNNRNTILAKTRAKAWRDYFTFKNCIICLDFPYAMTIHKSQGSTFNTVFLDIQDLGKCADKDYQTYLKLLYVAISRASNKVYTN